MTRTKLRMLALIAGGVLVLAALFVATRRPAVNASAGITADRVHSVAGELRGRQEAQFEVASGAESVTVHSAELGDSCTASRHRPAAASPRR
jgi:hypothetical protein